VPSAKKIPDPFAFPADANEDTALLASAGFTKQEYIGSARVILSYEIPLAEVIYDFYDKLKSVTKGYGTMDYDLIGFRVGELVKLDILVNGDRVDALSVIVHRLKAEPRGRKLLVRLKEEIAKHLFEIPLQAAIGGKVVARETIKSVGKNVTAKCYGGDVSRKRKLLEKQKEGKGLKRLVSVFGRDACYRLEGVEDFKYQISNLGKERAKDCRRGYT
jgi:GTP-binding protein LepA